MINQNNEGTPRVAVVTGAAAGLGRAISERLILDGYQVVLADVNLKAARATAADLGRSAAAEHVDIGQPESIKHLFERVKDGIGRCDVLINNAGIAAFAPFADFPLEQWQRTVDINLTGSLLMGQQAAALMRSAKYGRIVNITSVSGMLAGFGRTAYGTSKTALIGLTRQMAIELAPYGITVNSVAPGPVETAQAKAVHSDGMREEYLARIPFKRYGHAEEIAAAVSFLASEGASFITGHNLPVDGGFTAAGLQSS